MVLMLMLTHGFVDVDANLGVSFGSAFGSDVDADVDVAFWCWCRF